MKFKIDTAGNFYSDDDARKLAALGFEFQPDNTFGPSQNNCKKYTPVPEIDIHSLDDLIVFAIKYGGSVIIDAGSDPPRITIYDDYLE